MAHPAQRTSLRPWMGGWSLTDLGDNTRLLSERLLRTTKKKKNLFLWPIFRP